MRSVCKCEAHILCSIKNSSLNVEVGCMGKHLSSARGIIILVVVVLLVETTYEELIVTSGIYQPQALPQVKETTHLEKFSVILDITLQKREREKI